jgi:hypothetical protein
MKVFVSKNSNCELIVDEGTTDIDIRRALWALWTEYDKDGTIWKEYERQGDECVS